MCVCTRPKCFVSFRVWGVIWMLIIDSHYFRSISIKKCSVWLQGKNSFRLKHSKLNAFSRFSSSDIVCVVCVCVYGVIHSQHIKRKLTHTHAHTQTHIAIHMGKFISATLFGVNWNGTASYTTTFCYFFFFLHIKDCFPYRWCLLLAVHTNQTIEQNERTIKKRENPKWMWMMWRRQKKTE